MNAGVAAYKVLSVLLERLRTAALEAANALEEAEDAGCDPQAVIEAIRLEHTDWDKQMARMQTAGDILAAMGARTRLDLLVLVDDPIATRTDMAKFEWSQGFLAYNTGKHIRACPYPARTPSWKEWRDGWLEAKSGRHGG